MVNLMSHFTMIKKRKRKKPILHCVRGSSGVLGSESGSTSFLLCDLVYVA